MTFGSSIDSYGPYFPHVTFSVSISTSIRLAKQLGGGGEIRICVHVAPSVDSFSLYASTT